MEYLSTPFEAISNMSDNYYSVELSKMVNGNGKSEYKIYNIKIVNVLYEK